MTFLPVYPHFQVKGLCVFDPPSLTCEGSTGTCNYILCRYDTLTPAYLSCELAFCAHFQCVVRTYDLKCVENANQLVSTQGKIHEYSNVLGSVSALTNQVCLFRKIDIEVC